MPLFYEFRDDSVSSKPATIKGTYLDNYKNVWDLYITDSATSGAALLTATDSTAAAQVSGTITMVKEDGRWKASAITLNL